MCQSRVYPGHHQDELGRMEATLLGMDRMDLADGRRKYLMSRPLDVEKERIPRV